MRRPCSRSSGIRQSTGIGRAGNLISCDVFSTYPDGTPIGTQEFLVLETVTWDFDCVQ